MPMQLPEPLASFLVIGGPVVWIHVFMSVLLVTILLLKLWQFAAGGVFSSRVRARADRVVALWEGGDRDAAIESAEAGRDPQSRLLFHATGFLRRETLTGRALDEELNREASLYFGQLRSHLHTIELIAALAPLLGLLGTVLGMIEAFQAMEAAGRQVDPSVLSGGIWKALLTTAVGLVVAVPAIVLHNWLERRIENTAAGLSDRVTRILTAAASRVPPQAGAARTVELSRARA